MTAARRLALGLDFGTESVRALLVDVESGELAGRGLAEYAHGVMESELCDGGGVLPPEFALQHPRDYLDGLAAATKAALLTARARAPDGGSIDVVGIGVDFTACTMLPVDAQLAPLCDDPRFRASPERAHASAHAERAHTFVKLWKHHGAIPQAAAINATARELGEPWLARYGGTTSSEWLLAKAWETLEKAPAVYEAAARFVEASDWVVAQLTGRFVRGACGAGYKGLWHRRDGPPSRRFLTRLDSRLADFFDPQRGKARGELVAAGTRVGGLTKEWAQRLGLREGTAVSAPIIDAHAAVPGAGVTKPGSMVAILGTSACHMLMHERELLVPGIQGVVEDGILPGFFGYEAGQAAFGDTFDWLVERMLATPRAEQGRVHAELSREAATLRAGKSGLLVLDWWNGNRSVLVEPRLSGLIVGLTRATRPAQIYRALIEGAAFSTRKIVENFIDHGVEVHSLIACGGIAEKNELVLQVLADVMGKPIVRVDSGEVCAIGAAIFGAVAAGATISGAGAGGGGHATVSGAIEAMAARARRTIEPRADQAKTYAALYRRWERLHDHFGRAGAADPDDVMLFLRELQDAD